ncbi:MAG: GNAT family N-acetyltransferase [Acidiphilium sp.]|nr:GNAT family N-acetyltransferase [Acidiphilium sp.]MDD4934712.1 GNAT family N-acetyltransferase [Acidiphilium sp.]
MALIHRECFGAAAWPAASIATLFSSRFVFGFIADQGGMVIARAVADEAEVLTIGVVPALRRQGIARGLIEAVAAESAGRGARTLFLEVAAENQAALALYRAAHFHEAGVRRNYYGDDRDALLLRRALCE